VNIGTSVETNVNALCERMRTITGCPHPAKHAPARAGEQLRSVVAIDRAREVLGWRPEVTLDEGLRRTMEFFRARRAA
jgi:UDP-glucose 4-epimerase